MAWSEHRNQPVDRARRARSAAQPGDNIDIITNIFDGGTHFTGFRTALTRTINQISQHEPLLSDVKEARNRDSLGRAGHSASGYRGVRSHSCQQVESARRTIHTAARRAALPLADTLARFRALVKCGMS